MISESPHRQRKRPGVLPDGWERVRLTTVAQLESGHTPSRRMPNYWNGAIPWISLHDSNALDGREIFATKWTITEEGVANSSARLLPKGTVVFSRTATVGKATVMGRPMTTSQDFANYVCGPKVHNHYLVHLFRFMAPDWKRVMAGSIHNTIYMPVFEKLEVNLPPVGEQKVIASALHDVDGLLRELERLIAKKRDLKQAAMQQLLGYRSLGHRTPDNALRQLRQLLDIPITDGPHLTPQFWSSGIPFLSVNNLVGNRLNLKDLRFISPEDHKEFSKKCRPRRNDILFGKAASVGCVAVVESDMEFNVWSPIAVVRLSTAHDPRFFYYQFQTPFIRRQIELLTNSSSQGNIGMRDIERLEFSVPSLEEQRRIAGVLTDIDREIVTLEARYEKARTLKGAMMQQLLTGRIRLT